MTRFIMHTTATDSYDTLLLLTKFRFITYTTATDQLITHTTATDQLITHTTATDQFTTHAITTDQVPGSVHMLPREFLHKHMAHSTWHTAHGTCIAHTTHGTHHIAHTTWHTPHSI